MAGDDVLVAPNILEYPYKRTVGPIIGRFLTGLRERRIEGITATDGRVLCPPVEYDPANGESLTEDAFVPLPETGTVTTWTWVGRPREEHPLDHPFAFALIQLDGADTGMLHAVDAGEQSEMRTGMRVRVHWRDEREGSITDICCFKPEQGA